MKTGPGLGFKRKLKDGGAVIGTWNTLAHPLATEVLASAGFDFLIVDMEHGPFTMSALHNYVNACEVHGTTCLMRVPENQRWFIQQMLDQGAHGVLVPQVGTSEQARHVVDAAKYYPMGTRGYTPFSKPGVFGALAEGHANRVNEQTVTAILVESREAIERIEEICDVPGIDLIYFGAYDLSQSFGLPGDVKNPILIDAIENAVSKARLRSIACGGFVAHSEADIQWLIEMGMQFITYSVDTDLIRKTARTAVDFFQKESGRM